MTIPSKPTIFLSFALLFSLACSDSYFGYVGPSGPGDQATPMLPDLAGVDIATTPRCLAARGLVGEILKEDKSSQDFCIDFDGGGNSDTGLAARGWDLSASAQGCQGFSIVQGKLSINALSPKSAPDCQARLPELRVTSGTTKIVVAIVHTLSLTVDTQYGQIEVISNPVKRSGWAGQGVVAPREASLEFTPEPPLFKGILHARNTDTNSTALLPTWQIQSIAVLGIK